MIIIMRSIQTHTVLELVINNNINIKALTVLLRLLYSYHIVVPPLLSFSARISCSIKIRPPRLYSSH